MKKNNKGLSAVEILVALGVIILLGGITFGAFFIKYRSSSLERDVENAVSMLSKARNQAVASYNNSSYGVRISPSSIEIFRGMTYNDDGSDYRKYSFSGVIASSSLSAGSTDFYFRRLTGEPSATGTILFYLKSEASSSKTVIINSTGLAEVDQ